MGMPLLGEALVWLMSSGTCLCQSSALDLHCQECRNIEATLFCDFPSLPGLSASCFHECNMLQVFNVLGGIHAWSFYGDSEEILGCQ